MGVRGSRRLIDENRAEAPLTNESRRASRLSRAFRARSGA
jgi:hypothetical protein